MEYPCSDRCILYAICKQKMIHEKFQQCSIYADFITGTIGDSQDDLDKKYGKGKRTILGTRPPEGDGKFITKNGFIFDET